MRVTTREQREALHQLFNRSDTKITYLQFRRRFRWCLGDYIGGMWRDIFYGIELDGYTHT